MNTKIQQKEEKNLFFTFYRYNLSIAFFCQHYKANGEKKTKLIQIKHKPTCKLNEIEKEKRRSLNSSNFFFELNISSIFFSYFTFINSIFVTFKSIYQNTAKELLLTVEITLVN